METFKKLTTLEERLGFIETLELAIPAASLAGTGDDSPAASVDGASLMCFAEGLTAQAKSDVLNSCLLAQLAANKKYDREGDTENWYKFYSYVLQNIGWLIQEFQFSELRSSGSSFEPSVLMLAAMAPLCSPAQYAVLRLALDALSRLDAGSRSSKIFETSSHSDSNGNFQLGACTQSGNQVTMSLGGCYFSSKQKIVNILFSKFSSDSVTAYSGTQTITLDNDIYAQVRSMVLRKLGSHAVDFISDLDI